ncbi:MAG: PilN domain-containing protein [Gallionellaceae bacterium]|nr:PilN domain-containing protein [Gallionellaceae bacterium]
MSQQINLFNPVFLKQKKYFSVLAMVQALGLVILGSAVFYGYAVYQVKQLAKQSDDTAKRYTTEQAKLARYTAEFSPQQSSQLLEEELKKIEAQAAAQQELIETLKTGAIGNASGYSEYLRAFARQSVHGLWLTGFAITGDAVQMSLSGAALNPDLVPAYVQRLNREKIMRGKAFAALQMQQATVDKNNPTSKRYIEFTLQSVEKGSTP